MAARQAREGIGFARDADHARVRSWTNHPLVAAREIRLAAGCTLIEQAPHRRFGVDLVGRVYEPDLRS